MNKINVLIVEDSELLQRLWKRKLEPNFVVWQAFTIPQAELMYEDNKSDLSLIVLDGNVPGNGGNTLSLAKKIISDGFNPRRMLAISSDPDFNKKLVRIGCGHTTEKKLVVEEITKIFG